MAAHEKLSDIQFNYHKVETGGEPLHRISALAGPTFAHVGTMLWSSKEIRNVTVPEDQQRRGVATAMWEEGHRLATENKRIPKPRHSADRTTAGNAWAKSVGGRLPRQKQKG